ncbi:UNVERIFIED_ORG: hypothetical protein M2414_002387 [Rahnella aquatilis]
MSRIFEIVQAMSGQAGVITIPAVYLDFVFGDPQAHLLGAILNQLVFWSGKPSSQENGWFYKTHEELAAEIRGVKPDQVRKAVDKLITKYLPGIIQEAKRQVNGTVKKHYRVDGDALITKIFPPKPASALGSAILPNGNGDIAEPERQISQMGTAELPTGNGDIAEPILYTDHYSDQNKQIIKPSCPPATQPDESSDVSFLAAHPEAAVFDAKKRKWGSKDDLKAAEYIWRKIIKMYERAAECDGEIARPKEPDMTLWANEVRLMCTADGRTHKQICELFVRTNRDPFWCKNILSPSKLREKWDDLTIKLSANVPADTSAGGHWNSAEAWENTL